jgi:conjugative transfer region protein TrbK
MAPAPDRMLRFIALVLVALAAIAAANGLRESAARRPETRVEDAAGEASAELRRCRDLTFGQADGDATCKAAWAESRRRFLSAPASQHGLQD